MKNYSSHIKKLALSLGFLLLGGAFATQLQFSDSLGGFFPNLTDGDASVHFASAGNNFGGMIFFRGVQDVSTDGIILSGQTIPCAKQLKGLYYNSTRGNRMRPLDQESLNTLQLVDSSYTNVTLTGGLFIKCTGKDPASIAGQITTTRHGTTYKLIAGVQMISNTYTTTWADSLQYTGGVLSGKLFDNYGGVANILGTGITVNVDATGGNNYFVIPVVPSYPTTNSGISVGNASAPTISVPAGTNIVFGGTGDTTTITDPAIIPLASGTINLSGGVTIGNTGVIPGEIVQVNASGTSLILYQSGSTGSYVEIPDNTYIMGPSGRNNTLLSPTIVGNTITFGGLTPLLFIPPIKIFFANIVAGPTNLPQRRNPGEATWHDIVTVCNSGFGALPTNISLTGANKECYQTNGVSTIVWTHHATQYQILSLPVVPPTTTTTYHGGGSIALAMDNCKRSSNPATINLPGANDAGIDHSRSYYDRDCGVSSSTTTTTPTVDEEVTELGSIEDSPYSYDLNQAYLYGYKNKLTLADTVQKAGMKNSMTRKDLAIMVAGYAMRVLGIVPDATKRGCDKFTDTKRLDGDTQLYVMRSCQLGLMGLDTNGKVLAKFRPNELVTRAHFVAIFSRLLFANRYDGGKPYYEKHIAGLATHGIIKAAQNPQMSERRGYVMLMMMRADKKDVGRAQYHASASENGVLALLSE